MAAAAAAAAAARPPADVEVKLVVLGNTFVGKSCLLHRFTDGVFAGPAMMATVGVDWSIRTVELEPPPKVALAGGRAGAGAGAAAEPAAARLRVKLTLWDTAGQERFRSLAQSYYRGSDGVILCYAMDSRETFEAIGSWLDDIDKAMPKGIPRVLVATKADLAASAADAAAIVDEDEGEDLARRHGVKFYSTSAYTGAGVDAPFLSLAQGIIDRGGGKRRGEHAHVHAQGAGAGAVAGDAAAAPAEPVRLATRKAGGAARCSSC